MRTVATLIAATAGLTDALDIQILAQAVHQAQDSASSTQIGDTSLRLAFQMLEDQHNEDSCPDLMFFVRETFPTGKSDQLDPDRKGTDASGSGAYTTTLGLNVQKVFLPLSLHPLRMRLNLNASFPSRVPVRGLSSYGGDAQTAGDVYPGKSFNAIVAAEFHLTQHWVAALDLSYTRTGSDAFINSADPTVRVFATPVGGPLRDRVSVAPAIEYTFNENVGIIGGLSADVGRNITTTISPTIAVNVFH